MFPAPAVQVTRGTPTRGKAPRLSTFLVLVQMGKVVRSLRRFAVLVAGEPIERVRAKHGGYAEIIRRAAGEAPNEWIDVDLRDGASLPRGRTVGQAQTGRGPGNDRQGHRKPGPQMSSTVAKIRSSARDR